jgi:hypothetical protein
MITLVLVILAPLSKKRVYSYDASSFSIFEKERPRRARSPNIENEDASEASLVYMLRELATLVVSHALYVAEEYPFVQSTAPHVGLCLPTGARSHG